MWFSYAQNTSTALYISLLSCCNLSWWSQTSRKKYTWWTRWSREISTISHKFNLFMDLMEDTSTSLDSIVINVNNGADVNQLTNLLRPWLLQRERAYPSLQNVSWALNSLLFGSFKDPSWIKHFILFRSWSVSWQHCGVQSVWGQHLVTFLLFKCYLDGITFMKFSNGQVFMTYTHASCLCMKHT